MLLYVAAFLFSIGITIVITKKNLIHILLGIELMLNAVNINLIAFNQADPQNRGLMFALFVVVIAVSESAIALAIILQLVKKYKTADINDLRSLKD